VTTTGALHVPSIILHADTLMAIVHEGHRLDRRAVAPIELDVPRMRQGSLDAVVFSIFVTPYWEGETAVSRANWLIDRLDEELCRPEVAGSMRRVDSSMAVADEVAAGRLGAFIGIEGAHALGDSLVHLQEFAERGVRYITLTWANPNAWGDPAGGPAVHGGLSQAGRRLVREMEGLGVLVDVSHVADTTFWDAMAVASAPAIASHSSCRALCADPRNLTDDQLRALAATGGVVGINFHSSFLDDQLPTGDPWHAPWRGGGPFPDPAAAERADRYSRPARGPAPARLEAVVRHVLHAVDVAGVSHVSLGADFDGKIVPPVGLEDVSCLPALRAALSAEGLAGPELDGIFGGNFLRVLANADSRVGLRGKQGVSEQGWERP
jgi:membrane dipeptidase